MTDDTPLRFFYGSTPLDARAPGAPDRDWLALRARAPMRQPAGKANRRRPRPEQNDVSGLALFEPPLV